MKKLFIILSVLYIVLVGAFVFSQVHNDSKIKVYDTKDLNFEILESRKDVIIIEHCEGVVLDDELNGADPNGNYISYASVDGVKKGDKVDSYFVYNPNSQYVDDITERYDFIKRD